jgi:hypothetical protein
MFFTETLCMDWNHISQVEKMRKNHQKKKMQLGFFFQFCDVANLVTIHKKI